MSHASSSKVCKYDVFLSFRGKDTRRTFVSHLYNALKQRGIHTFKDDERLETGKIISDELLKAIEEAKFAVVIFSKSYASSRWCLEELAHIIKCKSELELVIPVFYDVSPSDVRHQNPPFAKSFSKHEKKYKDDLEKVQRWRDAFAKAGEIKGFHYLPNFEDEVDCIKKVVDDIFPKLLQVNPPFPESLVGMKDQVEKVISLLDMKSNDNVRFVGICGMGGIGKTKIATVIFEKYRSEFEGACFLDVGEGLRDNGIRWLQHALMYELFNEDLNVTSSYKGKNLIRMFHKKKVFIVLDNVNRKEELEALVGGREWFGEGSRILITTRYQRLLVTHMDEGYEVQLLPKHEAVELFRRHAFRSESPKEGFRGLSSQVVEYADGLPLALEVLGSSLYQRDEEEWRRIIARLKKIPDKDILGKLRISFDGLDKEEKRIFLDIACLYSDDSIDYVKRVFESCDINLQGIKNLVEKSLLSINRYRSLMHNTIREMGQNIAREEYTNSRIWLPEDVRDLFEGKLEAEKVEGMRSLETHYFKDEAFKKMQRLQVLKIDDINYGHVNGSTITYLPTSLRWVDWKCYPSSSLPEYFEPLHLVGLSLLGSKLVKLFWPTSKEAEKVESMRSSETHYFKDEAFKKMQRLQVLKIDDIKYGHVNGSTITYLPTSLRWVDWKRYPSSSLPEYFEPLHLVGLSLHDSKLVKHFWTTSKQKLSNLKHLDLSGSNGLTETPNFGDMPNLETLNLYWCENLEEVHPSLGHCRMLTQLDLSGCHKLKKLPELKLSNLKQLNLMMCVGLAESPNLGDMPNLETLILQMCNNLEEVHPSLGHCRMLTQLDLSSCHKLKKLPELKLSNLKHLNQSWCVGLAESPNLGDMPNLETLNLYGCENLEEVHPSLGHCRMLTQLDLSDCHKLKKLPELKLSNLKQLNLMMCVGLAEIPNLGDMPNLETLNLYRCENLEEVHPCLGHCRMLTQLDLSVCHKLKKLPELKLSNLKQLNLRWYRGLTETLNFGDMPNLETLILNMCTNLEEVHPSLGHCRMLTQLDLSYCDNLKKLPELKLSNLKQLNLMMCVGLAESPNLGDMPNLETLILTMCTNLEEVHPSLGHCRMLTQLDLSGCHKLKKLPELKLSNLKQLNLYMCVGLAESPNLGDMPNLETLNLCGCENLEEVHPSLGHCRMLRELDLSKCEKLKKLPELKLSNLKQLNLTGCGGLTESPNFGDMPNLETLNLYGCKNFEEVHPSLGHCRMLRKLDLSKCEKLKKLPELKLSNLKQLDLTGCGGLTENPNLGDMSNLETLILEMCKNLEEVHPSLGHCRMLIKLDLSHCDNLKKLPELKLSNLKQLNLRWYRGLTETLNFGDMPNLETLILEMCKNLEEVHPSLGHCKMLRKLDLSHCDNLKKLPELKLSNLKYLNLSWCGGLTEIPNFGDMPNLEILNLYGCKNLKEVHPSLGHCRMLRELDLSKCEKLKKLPELKLSNLKQLDLTGCGGLTESPNLGDKCTSLEEFPEIYGDMRRLTRLTIKSIGIRELPSFIGNLSSLTELNLKGCEDLVSLPNNLCNLNNLKHLNLCGCKKLEKLPENIGELQELQTLDARETAISQLPPSITKLGKISNLNILGELPEDLGSLQSLKSLDLRGSNISCLPKSIKELLGLETLDVQFCQNLNELPEELPPNLEKLCADYHLALKSIRYLVIKYLKLRFLSISWCGHEKSEYGTVSSEQVNVLQSLQHLIRTCIQCDYHQRDYFLICFPKVRILELFNYQFINQNVNWIDLSPSWYNDKFKGFSICGCTDERDWILIATLVCKSDPGRNHSLKYYLRKWPKWPKSAMCFIYIPFETLWHASDNKEGKNPNDYCLFEVYSMHGQGAYWGIRPEYENNDTAVTTEIWCSMELEKPEPSLTFGHLQAFAEHNIATDRGLHSGNENKDVEVDQAAMAVQKDNESQNVELTRVYDSPSRKMDDASRKRKRKTKRNRNKKRKIAGTDETSCSHFTNKHA
ncbi:TMV resistance protein N-like isoform X3 [Lycium barbarum]|uniref:TMV resistance protein N-like isoform X3 n=1 Tax=Lycium barbarum TaxID=112863 RepID=UPI00293F51F2|nr:TMV resistance protein N-like isoform X3 [Lycium barbarum]